MRTFSETVSVETDRAPAFVDITEKITDVVARSEIENGFVVIFSKHTTAAIKINEAEPLLLKDMECFLERLAPKESYYGHNDFAIRTVHMHEDECPNGHAHCQHLMLSTSEQVPLIDGEMTFGEWQRIFLVELDVDMVELPKKRDVVVQVVGA
ncbi:MAG: YjbQ family protein [Chloroflexi bacterium]|nr:YjbQ family protein [Chloroflexota bacterium]